MVLFDSNSQSFINDIPHYYVPYLKNISKGTYNGYGWIKENEKLKDINLAVTDSIFIRRSIWEALQKHTFPDRIKFDKEFPYKRINVPSDLIAELTRVTTFCQLARVDLCQGLAFKGSQICDVERYAELLKLKQQALYELHTICSKI